MTLSNKAIFWNADKGNIQTHIGNNNNKNGFCKYFTSKTISKFITIKYQNIQKYLSNFEW